MLFVGWSVYWPVVVCTFSVPVAVLQHIIYYTFLTRYVYTEKLHVQIPFDFFLLHSHSHSRSRLLSAIAFGKKRKLIEFN